MQRVHSSSANAGRPFPDVSLPHLPPREKLWAWQAWLAGLGPRPTGSAAQAHFVDFLQKELEALGLEPHRESTDFTRWEAREAGLSLLAADGSESAIPISSCYPYSGTTPPEGIVAPLQPCDRGYKKLAGKIGLIEVGNLQLPSFALFKPRHGKGMREKLPLWIDNPVISATLLGPDLNKAKKAGALGMIAVWKDLGEAEAQGQYLPFTTGPRDCPTLWVGPEAGKRLKAAALQREKSANTSQVERGSLVRLRLDATFMDKASSDSLYAILPGRDHSRTILVNTHTDGPNACEENGPIALLALAQAFAALPQKDRACDLVFVFVTGHFQIPQFGLGGQASTRWLQKHPELWDGKGDHARAIAGLTLEHLGCREWTTDPRSGSHQASGRLERELVYASTDYLSRLYQASLEGRGKARPLVLNPKRRMYFGEGEPLYKAGIPTLSLVPAPGYLCATSPSGFLERLDAEFFEEQVRSFAKVIEGLLKTETS